MEYTALHYEKLSDRAKAPKRATPGSIGLDLFTPIDVFIPAKQQVLIPTDFILVPTQGARSFSCGRSTCYSGTAEPNLHLGQTS